MKYGFMVAAAGLFAAAVACADDYSARDDVQQFINEMVTEHRFSREQLRAWLAQAEKKQSILDAISRPAEKRLTWSRYRKIFLTTSRIEAGVQFWEKNQDTLARVEKAFGVPAEIIVAVIGVETLYGSNKGSFRVIDALSTLGFDYPPRAKFFRKELKQFFLLAREQQQDPLTLTGSYAGAMGYGQFIPSSYRAYAIDYTGDGFADIWNNPTDAIGSVANYFKRHGWKPGEPTTLRARASSDRDDGVVNDTLKPQHTLQALRAKGYESTVTLGEQMANIMRLEGTDGPEFWLGLHNFYVITRYNHSRLYAMAVWQLSQEIAQAKAGS